MKVKKYRHPFGYYCTIAEYRLDWIVIYWIDRFSNGNYRLLCHIVGSGTDTLATGNLAKCYQVLKKHTSL